MSSFSPVIRVRKLLDKIKSERSPRLKRISSRTLSEEANEQSRNGALDILPIPAYKKKMIQYFPVYTGENQFNLIPDEAALLIFSFLDSRDLCRMSQVSKQMFGFANDELTWKALAMFDWGIIEPFSNTWKESYALLEDLCADGMWEGMSKWLEPAGFDPEQKTTARLHFVKRSRKTSLSQPEKSSPTAIHRVDSQTTTPPISKAISAEASNSRSHQEAPHRVIGSGITVNGTTPSPFKIEGQRTSPDATGCAFEWNKQFEHHTSVYTGKMDYSSRSVSGIINYNDGHTKWKGIFSYTKMRNRGTKLIVA